MVVGAGNEAFAQNALPADTGTHVVMMVANDVSTDSRVKKEALALAATGARVTVLGVARDNVRSLEQLGDALILRIPVLFRLRDERTRRRRVRRAWRLPFVGYRSRAIESSRRLRVRARIDDVDASSGSALSLRRADKIGPFRYRAGVWVGKFSHARWNVQTKAIRLRSGIGRRVDRVFVFGWKGWDWLVSRATWPARWRSVLPEAHDYELTFGPILDQLKPDAVHAHDMHLIGVAVRAAGRATLDGRRVAVVYDAHEYVAGMAKYPPRTPRFIAAWANHEREYIRAVDRVVTVSPGLADVLRDRYALTPDPAVVLNTPRIEEKSNHEASVRTRAGVMEEDPLLVYSGGLTPARGVDLVIEALTHLPGVHLAVVCVPDNGVPFVGILREKAARVGVAQRVHFLNPVSPSEVVGFLRSADVGVHPLIGGVANHDIALPNKLFEYVHAGIPLVVSDLPSIGKFVRTWGVGMPFQPGDAKDLARQVETILAAPEPFRAATQSSELLHEISWSRQADVLLSVYEDLLDRPMQPMRPVIEMVDDVTPSVTAEQRVAADRRSLVIGPANSAGQAWNWARALERHYPHVVAESLMVNAGAFGFPCHVSVAPDDFHANYAWMVDYAWHVLRERTHVLFEAGRPIMGQPRGGLFDRDVPSLQNAGLRTGIVFHGSEIRDPRRHAELYRYSPFVATHEQNVERLQLAVDTLAPRVADFAGPKYVSTPDLLDFVADAMWLPLVVDVDALASDGPVLERSRPIVLHAPSNGALKGSAVIDPILQSLHDRRVVEYRRVSGMTHGQLIEVIRDADIVVDQILLGSYGVLACESMAAGRVTVAHVADRVRDRVAAHIPLVEATPADFAEVIGRIVDGRDEFIKMASGGPDYVRRFHDGTKAARVLGGFLNLED
jgi:glycosyltransferase involved in cell wall biosynthesis